MLVATGGARSAASNLFGCLGSLVLFGILSVISYFSLQFRNRQKYAGKDKPEFTSLRSIGKTVVNEEPDDEDPPGGVN